ncbi:hypothetical protein Btru_045256 [Bulinus truncatus]|nr:hypothetical protein Btru_045256 [Bulinus truncatus]
MFNPTRRLRSLAPFYKSVLTQPVSTQSTTEGREHTKPFEDIPGPRGIYQWPFIGPLLLFRSNTDGVDVVLDKLFDQYGPIVKVQLFSPHVLISDPKDFETVFRNEGRSPQRPKFTIVDAFSKRQNLQEPLVNLQGDEWYNLRDAANKRLMKVNSALHYLQQQNEVADDFVKILSTQDVKSDEILLRYTSESVGVVVFNKRLGFLDSDISDETRDIFDATKNVGELLALAESGRSVAHTLYRNKTYREFERAYLTIRRNASDQVNKAKEELVRREKEGQVDPSEQNLLLSLTSEKSLTDDDVNNILSSMYIGGADSTAKTLQLVLYNLAKHSDKQERLRNEITSLIGSDGPLTASALSQMSYLKACVKESFRTKYPMIGGRTRTLPTDCEMSGYLVPAGTNIIMVNASAVKMSFKDLDSFTPERWLRTNQDRKTDAASNLVVAPFGHGSRSCLGQRLAMQEMYLGVVKILQKLKIELHPDCTETEFIYKLFLEPVKPLRFIFTKLT